MHSHPPSSSLLPHLEMSPTEIPISICICQLHFEGLVFSSPLQELLECEDDVEDIFCQSFQISHSSMGETVTIDLKPMGSEIPVTNKNRQEFVDLYVKFLLVDAIQRQFQVSMIFVVISSPEHYF